MRPTPIALFVLFAACKKASDAPPPKSDDAAAIKAAVTPDAAAAAAVLGAAAAAKDFATRVCACKDDACGQAAMEEASQKMPALMQTATEAEQKDILAARDQAIACMDKLVDSNPEAAAAIAEGDAFSKEACACTDAACADQVVVKHREPLKKGLAAGMSNSAIDHLMSATAAGTTCLEKTGYMGTPDPELVASAKATADAVCACTDQACVGAALRAGSQGMAAMVAPADRQAVGEATSHVQACMDKLAGAAQPTTGLSVQAIADHMVTTVCACKDDACAEKAISDMASAIGGHDITQDDLKIMTDASQKADACRAKQPH